MQMKLNRSTVGAAVTLVLGILCALAATSRGMLVIQSLTGIGDTFSVGKAILSKNDDWLLLDYRERRGARHMKFGFLASIENGSLPEGRYYSFEDINRRGHVTFIETDQDTIARIGGGLSVAFGCESLGVGSGRRLVRCQPDNRQVLLYDLDRAFVVAISPIDNHLLTQVLAVILK